VVSISALKHLKRQKQANDVAVIIWVFCWETKFETDRVAQRHLSCAGQGSKSSGYAWFGQAGEDAGVDEISNDGDLLVPTTPCGSGPVEVESAFLAEESYRGGCCRPAPRCPRRMRPTVFWGSEWPGAWVFMS
jgi:hypothetical protein